MEMKPENIPDEMLIQAKVVCAQLLIQTNTPDICLRNFGHLYGWTRHTNNAGRRIQAFDTVRYGGTLLGKKL